MHYEAISSRTETVKGRRLRTCTQSESSLDARFTEKGVKPGIAPIPTHMISCQHPPLLYFVGTPLPSSFLVSTSTYISSPNPIFTNLSQQTGLPLPMAACCPCLPTLPLRVDCILHRCTKEMVEEREHCMPGSGQVGSAPHKVVDFSLEWKLVATAFLKKPG